MMMFDYRGLAKDCLKLAKAELGSGDSVRLRYAALQVRQCMEAITYSRAQAYKSELPPEALNAWRPRAVLSFLEELDPNANLSATISFGIEHEYGIPPPSGEMKTLGTDQTLSAKTLKQHYDAIGSYLHIPTMAQIEDGKIQNNERLKNRLLKCISVVEQVLASPIYNSTLGVFATLEKCSRLNCGKPVRRRITKGHSTFDANCSSCGATYEVSSNDDGTTVWRPKASQVNCTTKECSGHTFLWEDELKPGTVWRCETCGKGNKLVLCLDSVDLSESSNS
jgi:hypothetical protein